MWYAVYRADGSLQSTGTVEPIAADIVALGWFYKPFNYNIQARDKQWNTVTQNFDTITIPKDRITVAVFKSRFLDDEYDNLIGLAKSVTKLGAWLDRLNTLPVVDLENDYLIKGITFLVSQGELTPVRAAEILA